MIVVNTGSSYTQFCGTSQVEFRELCQSFQQPDSRIERASLRMVTHGARRLRTWLHKWTCEEFN